MPAGKQELRRRQVWLKSVGEAAEAAALRHVQALGLEVVATNLRVGKLELDIVAREGPVIVVIEVRSRGSGSWTSGFGSMDAKKRERIRRAGERLWQRRYKYDSSVDRMRFDAASVTFTSEGPRVEYAKAAF